MVWCGVVWCGVVWCGVVWCGVVWCGVVWCGVLWCGVVWWAVWCGVVRCIVGESCIGVDYLSVSVVYAFAGCATAHDLGHPDDIHPPDKREVGRRLALAAQAVVYGLPNVIHEGPVLQSVKVSIALLRAPCGMPYSQGGGH